MTLLEERAPTPITVDPVAPPAIPIERPQPRAVSSRTFDDWMTLGGAAISAISLTWLLYTQVLPFSGKLGFVLTTYVAFVGIYAGLTALSQPLPMVRDRVASALVQGGALVVGAALVCTVVYTFYRGFDAYRHWNFFTQDMSAAGPQDPLTKGGIRHALVGSLIELGIAVVISLPLGVVTAVYLVEVGGRFAKVVRTVIEAMTALPDLVAGLFIYAFYILFLGSLFPGTIFQRNGFAAALALSITMLPIIARSSDVVLRVVPSGLREASLALGASTWRTVWSVVLPTARSGLAGALILGMARGIGETAPVLIVSQPSSYFTANPFGNPMNSLPLFAYIGLRAPDPNSNTRGYGAACVLLAVVIVLFVIVRLLARQRSNGPSPWSRLTRFRSS